MWLCLEEHLDTVKGKSGKSVWNALKILTSNKVPIFFAAHSKP
jgi:hypothetical protein